MGVASMRRRAVPRDVERALYQEVGSKCPKCGEADVKALTIHHIVEYAKACGHNPDAMIVLCANCHARAGRREITEDELFQMKRALQVNQPALPTAGPGSRASGSSTMNIGRQAADNIINIAGDNTTVRPPKKRTTVIIAPQPGSISDAQSREINDRAAKIAAESKGRTTVGFVKKRIKQKYHLTAVRNLPASEYPAVMADLRKWKWAVRSEESPQEERNRLLRELHAKAGNIGWSHEFLSLKCREWYGYSVGDLSTNLLKDAVSKVAEISENV
jgi:signal transduction histidine kinase